ncbi:2-dehydro-3-deoxygalactonokinase [Thalassotalea crassostreae]|uniref:2-dehydro-3-deoxygalactonokinase n=1 Tax=Thalassotalea crassostreae TaxID=1763536 RepID=UPI000837EB4E|nr:2-dehydro-3-deoxygalactonokinase [Thalassotalea crassostreae]
MLNIEHVIVADWGSTHLRAYLCKVNDTNNLDVIDTAKGLGITKIDKQFEQHLFQLIAPWKDYGQLPIILSGQVGSTVGWKEADYLSCPVLPKKLASSCFEFSCQGHQIFIVPGLSCETADHNSDVMRGEELQIFGLLLNKPQYQQGRHLICLPGTHTKWVLIDNGEVQLFKTAMTGELYDLLTNHSVLIQKQTDNFDLDAFTLGVNQIKNSEVASLSHNIFSVRTKQLFGQINEDNACSYLSGILIGSDVHGAIHANEWDISNFESVLIVGSKKLVQSFATALNIFGYESILLEEADVAIAGYSQLYKSLFSKT